MHVIQTLNLVRHLAYYTMSSVIHAAAGAAGGIVAMGVT